MMPSVTESELDAVSVSNSGDFSKNKLHVVGGDKSLSHKVPKNNFHVKQRVPRETVFSEIKSVIGQLPRAELYSKNQKDVKMKELLKAAKDALLEGDFVRAELNLNLHRDLQRGIVSRYITNNPASAELLKMPLYLADSRNVLAEKEQDDTFENWASMGLSYFRIAIRMIENEIERLRSLEETEEIGSKIGTLEKEIEIIKIASVHFLDEISKLATNNEKFRTRDEKRHAAKVYESHGISKKLIPYVAKVLDQKKPKELQKEMERLKDFGSLDREPFASATITAGLENDDHFTVRVDVPVYQLTQKQQNQIRAIIDNTDEKSDNLPAWYRDQTDLAAKKMIRLYAPAILVGRDLPTQMLQFIPFLRNAKQKQHFDVSINAETKKLDFEKTADNFGTGNIGSEMVGVSSDNIIQGTQEALEQFQAESGAEKTFLQSLVTTSRIRLGVMKLAAFLSGGKKPGDEVTIDANNRMAVMRKSTGNEAPSGLYKFFEKWSPFNFVLKFFKKENASQNSSGETQALIPKKPSEVIYGNLAINDSRRMNNPNMEAANAIYQEASNYVNHARELSTKNPSTMTNAMQKIIIQLRWLQEEFDGLNSFVFIDDDNRNLQIAAKTEQMVSLMRVYREKCVELNTEQSDEAKKIVLPTNVASSAFCKSAKDRAGMVQIAEGEAEARKNAVSKLYKLNEDLHTDFKTVFENCIAEKPHKTSVLQQIYKTVDEQKNYKIETLKAIWSQIKGGHVGRSASNQSAGSEGIKNGEGIIPKWIVKGLKDAGIPPDQDFRALLEREEAHFNSKVAKIKMSDSFVEKVLEVQQFEMLVSNSTALASLLKVDPKRTNGRNLSEEERRVLEPSSPSSVSNDIQSIAGKVHTPGSPTAVVRHSFSDDTPGSPTAVVRHSFSDDTPGFSNSSC